MEVKACFAFVAHPEHYSPHISKSPPFWFHHVCLKLRGAGLYLELSGTLSTTATVLLDGGIIVDEPPWHLLCVCSDVCVPLSPPTPTPTQALLVNFEADTERRKLGLPHRVNFLGRSSLDPEYTQTEEVELRNQRHHACTSATFQLHVSQRRLAPVRAPISKRDPRLNRLPPFCPRRRTSGTSCGPSRWR